MRLGKKLILISSAIVVAVLGCGGFLAMRANEEFQIRLAKAQALQQADLITKSVRYHMLTNRREDVQWIMEMIGQQQGIAQIRIFNDTGTVAYAARQGDIGARVDKAAEGCAYCHKRGA
jgi:sensor histidine kinase regulating citrate/malate metabolism